MPKFYNKPFKVGVLFIIVIFIGFNFVSYFAAYRNHQEYMNREIKFSSVYGFPSWGFPFNWDENFFTVIDGAGGIINILIAAFCSFVFGFLFKFIWSKISSRRIELK